MSSAKVGARPKKLCGVEYPAALTQSCTKLSPFVECRVGNRQIKSDETSTAPRYSGIYGQSYSPMRGFMPLADNTYSRDAWLVGAVKADVLGCFGGKLLALAPLLSPQRV